MPHYTLFVDITKAASLGKDFPVEAAVLNTNGMKYQYIKCIKAESPTSFECVLDVTNPLYFWLLAQWYTFLLLLANQLPVNLASTSTVRFAQVHQDWIEGNTSRHKTSTGVAKGRETEIS